MSVRVRVSVRVSERERGIVVDLPPLVEDVVTFCSRCIDMAIA